MSHTAHDVASLGSGVGCCPHTGKMSPEGRLSDSLMPRGCMVSVDGRFSPSSSSHGNQPGAPGTTDLCPLSTEGPALELRTFAV